VDTSNPPSAIKRLGQNFLIDPNIVRKIVSAAGLAPNDPVLEIGPGRGILTAALCRSGCHVTAIEIDPRLHSYVSKEHAGFPNLDLVLGDAMTYPIENLPKGTVVVANLPYYISTPLLFRLLQERGRFPHMVLMLQDEVANRLAATPGTPEYGILSVMAQYAADITKVFKVSPNCFRPRPEVGSAVVRLDTKEDRTLPLDDEPRFAAIVKGAFAHRRKTLMNSLRDEGHDQDTVLEALRTLSLASTARAEVLSVDDFIGLTRLISSPRPKLKSDGSEPGPSSNPVEKH